MAKENDWAKYPEVRDTLMCYPWWLLSRFPKGLENRFGYRFFRMQWQLPKWNKRI